jgi:conjugative relaxase-like TrwC/TraI family protein
MLTTRVMRNGTGYAKKHLERNDYYAEGEKVTGQWFGKGAEKLGLEGQVEHEQFERVRQGLHPETGEKLRQRNSHRTSKDGSKEAHGRNLYDFTFSAPKSISIMAILGGDERLIEAHDRAVQEALAQLERHAATRVRMNNQDTDRITGNLIVACYPHDASRRLDPQLHTHCVAANMTYDAEEQRWKALQAVGIYERSAFLSEVYRNILAHEVESLGYETENRKNGFEIKHVSQSLIEEFSLGSHERDLAVAAFIEKQGRTPTGSEIAVMVRESRPDKLIDISTAEVRASQLARLSPEHARELATVREQADRNRTEVKTHSTEESLQHGLDHVFERVSVAPDYEVLAEALRHGRGHLKLDDLTNALRQREVRDEIIRAGDDIAPRASLERERDMIHLVNRGQAKYGRLAKYSNDFQVSEKLNAEQRKVIDFVLDSRDFAVNIEGAAGTGKTATLKELCRGLQAGGRLMVGVAPTLSAAEELKKAGIQNAMTVERLLQDKENHPTLTGRAIIVDEAGMVSGRQMHELLSLASRFDARVVFSGDTRQLQSVEASDALRILQKESRLATVGLREVQRQQTKEYKDAIKTLRSDPAKGFEKLVKMGAVVESGLLDRPEAVAEAYSKAKGTVLVVCPTHEEIGRITTAIRAGLRQRGELATEKKLERLEPLNWTEAQKRDMANFVPGQVLVFHKGTKEARKHEAFTVTKQDGNVVSARSQQGKEIEITKKQAKAFGVFDRREIGVAAGDWLSIQANVRDGAYQFTNGERVRVANVTAREAIQLEDGRTIPHNFRQFNHGYAVTAHKSQGKTVDAVIISGDRMTQELFYVAASRGRKLIQVFTGDKEMLRAAIGVSGLRMSALELLRRSTRTVDRTRFAERPPTIVERIGKVIEKVWQNVPRLMFGQLFAPEREDREIGR